MRLRGVKQARRCVGIAKIRLDGYGSTPSVADRGHDVSGVRRPVAAVRLGHRGIQWILDPPTGAQHGTSSTGQRQRRRRADPVVGTGHDRDMRSSIIRTLRILGHLDTIA
jgi:hypothetical protein